MRHTERSLGLGRLRQLREDVILRVIWEVRSVPGCLRYLSAGLVGNCRQQLLCIEETLEV